jgi:hypothetical protein
MGCGCNKNNPPPRQRIVKKTINTNVRSKNKITPTKPNNTNYKNPTPRRRK